MAERIVSPNLIDTVEAIDRIRASLTGLSLEDFENSWEKRWLVERGIEIISEASRRFVGRFGAQTGGRRGLKPAVMAPISYPAAIAASLATVFMLRAVPSPAAGMRNLERPIPSG